MWEVIMHFGTGRAYRLTDELRSVNSRMKGLLDRLPLSNHMEIAELANLAKMQVHLMEQAAKPRGDKERLVLDGERCSAMHLRQRYSQALYCGGVRHGFYG